MKKLFTIISAIVLLGACVKIEDFAPNYAEITFNTKTSVSTKAIVDTTGMVDHFGVYGWVVPGDYSNGGYLMKNAEYNESGDAVNGTYYWPKSDNNLGIDFIFTAYSQFDNNPVWENDTLKLAIPTLTQDLINNPDNFDDVLWAQTKYNYHQNSLTDHERVNLNFKHALSWLQFRGEVENTNIKWVKVKQISFGEYRDTIPGVPAIPEVPAYDDTTDTWVNLKRTTNVVGTSSVIKGPGESTYTVQAIPDSLLAHIKSYYSVDTIKTGNYSLNLSAASPNYNWDPINGNRNLIRKLRVIKEIPAEYRLHCDMHNEGIYMDFFNAKKYLNDKGYYIDTANSGGKPAVLGYVYVDAYWNNGVYTLVGFNYSDSISVPEYTIEHHDAIPGVPGVDPIPSCGSEGLYIDGTLCLPTKDTLTTTPLATYGAQKDTTLNYVKAQVDTIKTNDHIVLGNALVIPQPVPQNITIVFDICIVNPTGDEVIFTDRKITRVINANKDMKDVDYVASWTASNKYIYNFRFDGDILNFSTLVSGWTVNGNEYHVWDY